MSTGEKLDFAEAIASDLVEVYKATIEVLGEAVKVGKTQPITGLIALRLYADLLHGGAYKVPAKDLPYYSGGAALVAVTDLTLPIGASEAQKEVMMNSETPHVFPKLLSDQAYFHLQDLLDKSFQMEVLTQLVSTNVRTLVEGIVFKELGYPPKAARIAKKDLIKMLSGRGSISSLSVEKEE